MLLVAITRINVYVLLQDFKNTQQKLQNAHVLHTDMLMGVALIRMIKKLKIQKVSRD